MNLETNYAFQHKAQLAFNQNMDKLAEFKSDIMLLHKHNWRVSKGLPSVHNKLKYPTKRATGYFHMINKHNVAVDIIYTRDNECFVNKVKFVVLESAIKYADSIKPTINVGHKKSNHKKGK